VVVLGIESSCDDSAAAVLRDDTLLSSVVSSQDAVHGPYGGVVPELASRHHVRNLLPVVDSALARAALTLSDVDGVAVTCGPGLVGSLLVGLTVAKGIAQRRRLPLVGVNHLEGHLLAVDLAPAGRAGGVPVSRVAGLGGHTGLYLARGQGDYACLGRTRDDAVGEAFDKAAKLLGLGYPGGPVIQRTAANGDPRAVRFPRAHVKRGRWDFSFSGFKTALREHVARTAPTPDGCRTSRPASRKGWWRCSSTPTDRRARTRRASSAWSCPGGVAANARLRARLTEDAAAASGVEVLVPAADLCTDNAAMIARAGAPRLARGRPTRSTSARTADLPFGVPWTG
jgi:N6-L-threonylcarbamoyladenine synthase